MGRANHDTYIACPMCGEPGVQDWITPFRVDERCPHCGYRCYHINWQGERNYRAELATRMDENNEWLER